MDLTGCLNAVNRFYEALDRSDYDTAVGVLHPTIEWMRLGTMLTGRDAVRGVLSERPADRRTVHVVDRPIIEATEDGTGATVRYVLTVHAGAASDKPVPMTTAVLESQDRLILENGQWFVSGKSSRVVFSPS